MGPGRQPIILVDLLRFACAAAVVAHHYLTCFQVAPSRAASAMLAGAPLIGDRWTWSARLGWLGVEIFFVISGMVIAQSLREPGAWRFLRRRLLRLVPAAWVCATITAAAMAIAGLSDAGLAARWISSLAFWPFGEQVDTSYWTLGVELSFYLVVAAFATRGPEMLDRLAMWLTAWSGAFWIATACAGPEASQAAVVGLSRLALLPHGCLFALGIVIARSQEDGITAARLGTGAGALAICLIELWAHEAERAATFAMTSTPWMAGSLFLAGMMLLAVGGRVQAPLARWMKPQTARKIGLTTYPLYLVHQEAGAVLAGGLVRSGFSTLSALALAGAAMLMTAWIIADRIEPVIRARLGRALDLFSNRGPAPYTLRTASPPGG